MSKYFVKKLFLGQRGHKNGYFRCQLQIVSFKITIFSTTLYGIGINYYKNFGDVSIKLLNLINVLYDLYKSVLTVCIVVC